MAKWHMLRIDDLTFQLLEKVKQKMMKKEQRTVFNYEVIRKGLQLLDEKL
jgi:hypothetical protein